jgi:LPXTG-motif cell wall-anchored protein
MRRRLLITGMALALMGVVAIPSIAYADATCYTGCTTTVTANPTPSGIGTQQPATTSPIAPKTASAGGLALTGADIEGLVVVGCALLVIGGLLIRRTRRRHRAAA